MADLAFMRERKLGIIWSIGRWTSLFYAEFLQQSGNRLAGNVVKADTVNATMTSVRARGRLGTHLSILSGIRPLVSTFRSI